MEIKSVRSLGSKMGCAGAIALGGIWWSLAQTDPFGNHSAVMLPALLLGGYAFFALLLPRDKWLCTKCTTANGHDTWVDLQSSLKEEKMLWATDPVKVKGWRNESASTTYRNTRGDEIGTSNTEYSVKYKAWEWSEVWRSTYECPTCHLTCSNTERIEKSEDR